MGLSLRRPHIQVFGMGALFGSNRWLVRAENINALYEAYDGQKDFIILSQEPNMWFGKRYTVLVADDFPQRSPGKTIMIGHGICGGKRFGLDQPKGYHKAEYAKLLDYAIATSEETIDIVAKQSGISADKVLPLGMPRTDQYIGKKKGDGGTYAAHKRTYLYVPTFRNPRLDPPLPDLDFDLIDDMLTDNELFVVKMHMLSKSAIPFGGYKHIREEMSMRASAKLLIDSDVVITDYSSIMFDAQMLGKPVILFDRNMDYLQTRGMYYKYPDEYCGRWCNNERDLIEMARAAHDMTDIDRACIRRVAGACDGHSTERIIDLIRSLE